MWLKKRAVGVDSAQPGVSSGHRVAAWTWDWAGKFSVPGTALEQWCRSQLWEMVLGPVCKADVLGSHFQEVLVLFPEVREYISRDGGLAQTVCQAQKMPRWGYVCIQAVCSELMLGQAFGGKKRDPIAWIGEFSKPNFPCCDFWQVPVSWRLEKWAHEMSWQ